MRIFEKQGSRIIEKEEKSFADLMREADAIEAAKAQARKMQPRKPRIDRPLAFKPFAQLESICNEPGCGNRKAPNEEHCNRHK